MTQESKKFFGVEQALLAAHTLQMHFVIYYELQTSLSTYIYTTTPGGLVCLSVHHDFLDVVENLPFGFVYSNMYSRDLENENGKWRVTTFEFEF